MRKLIGALLTLTALSPLPAAAQADRDAGIPPRAEDRVDMGPRPARNDAREDRGGYRGDGGRRPDRSFDRPDRPDRVRQDTPVATSPDRPRFADPRPDGEGRADLRRPDRVPRQSWGSSTDDRRDRAGRPYPGPAYADRDARRPDADSTDGRRSDWTRSQLDRRDDRWTRSRFEDRSAWNRDWRSDRRYDWTRYRDADRGAYRLPRYYAPGGWGGGYRRFGIGLSLNRALWARDYWIADPYSYRLPDAYGPYRWVRYYDDALLVDLRSGIVVDAVYGIFW